MWRCNGAAAALGCECDEEQENLVNGLFMFRSFRFIKQISNIQLFYNNLHESRYCNLYSKQHSKPRDVEMKTLLWL